MLFHPESCVYTCCGSQREALSRSQNSALLGWGLGFGFNALTPPAFASLLPLPPPRGLAARFPVVPQWPPFLVLSIHCVILESLVFLARVVSGSKCVSRS